MNKRDAYLEKARARIDEYSASLDVLKAKAKSGIVDRKFDANAQIAKLEEKIKVSKSRLAELADTAEDRWEDLSGRFELLADDLGASFRRFLKKDE